MRYIPKQLKKSVSGDVRQPLNLSSSASLNFLSLAASTPRMLSQILGAFLPYSRFFKLLRYHRLFFLLATSLLVLAGCRPYYLSVCQEWIDVRYLASYQAGTPDPRLSHPPEGQKLILDWRVPKEIFKRNPEVVLDVILWDYTARQLRFPVKSQMDFATFKLLNEEYVKSGGILTYKATIVTEDGEVFREWKHQLWVNLITVSEDNLHE